MSDNRQPKWNTQVAGNVGDISHLGRKPQENKLPENIARQTILRQELRWQESRRSSQDNGRQEIKHTIEQPVLNPSIQSTSDLGPPSDQIFKRQDASAKLSTMKSVNPKKIQENPPQKFRSNQEIPRQAVELQKVELEPQKVGFQKIDPQKVGPQQVGPQQVEPQEVRPQEVDRHKVEPQKVEPQTVDRHKFDPQKVGPQEADRYKVEPPKVDRQKVDPQTVGSQEVDRHKLETQKLDRQKVDPQKVGPQKFERQKIEHQKFDTQKFDPQIDPQKVEPQQVEPQKVDRHKLETQKLDRQKVDPQKVGPQKFERQKIEHQKFDPQKVDPQKLDPQEVGPQEADRQKADPQKIGSQEVDRHKVEPQKVEPQTVDRHKLDPQKLVPQEVDRHKLETQKADPLKVWPQKFERQKIEHQKVDPQKVDPQKVGLLEVDRQKVDRQRVDRQKVDHQKIDHQKVGHQKVDSHKIDYQKVEGRHSFTPLHDFDHSASIRASSSLAQLTTETQETKSDGYTHNQGEHTAQYVHNNIPDQNPAKINLFAKSTPREYPPAEIKSEKEEIEPQEVKPQDVVPIKFSLGQRALDSELSLSQQSFKLPEDKTDKHVPFGSKNIQRVINRPSTPKTSYGMPAPKPKKKSIGSSFNFLKGALVKQVKTEELSQDDVIIAVMGPTGSGKSTFVEIATDFDTGVGHNLESCTSEINIVKLSLPELADGDVVFVDTPGFDDTHKSDVEILKMVADWLKTTYEKEILLSGLLYFHRISDNRMAGTPLKNLRMFEELCGKNALHNVILVTTMWDEVDEETGNLRETELKSKYWRSMLDYSSTTSRFMHTRESALGLIEPFVEAANTKSSLLLQKEMVDMRAKLPATSAGVRVFSEMEDLVKKRQEVLKQIRNAMKQTNEDPQSLSTLQGEYQRLKTQLDVTVNEMRQLKLPVGKRLSRMTRKWFSFRKFSF